MAQPWRYATADLKGLDEVKLRLSMDQPKLIVLVSEYCVGMPIIYRFIVPGAIPQLQPDGTFIHDQKCLLAKPAQELIRAVLVLLEQLFEAGYFLKKITDSTFFFDTSTATVLLSKEALEADVLAVGNDLSVIDNTIASVAHKLHEWLFVQNNEPVEDLPEVCHSLFPLMETGGDANWYAIINNMCLVPLENRREAYIRIYEQIKDVVMKANRADYEAIMEEISFPSTWYDAVAPDLNGVLFTLYSQAVYRVTAPSKKEQAEVITKCFRNTGAHVFQELWYAIGRADVALIHYAVAPLLATSMQAALQKRGWLVSTNIHTLIVYTRKSYAA